jgi:para-nitrobenzyl esterase
MSSDGHTTRRELLAGTLGGGLLLASPWQLAANAAGAGDPAPTRPVDTGSGKVRGLRAGGVSTFLGIPYGSDTGTHRFRAAHAPAPWSGVRDCMALGHQAPQMAINASAMTGGANLNSDFIRQVMTIFREGMEEGNEGEDCLVLNVYTPDASPRRRRPVMVWLHGGGFSIGSAGDPQYNGSALARRGDVVVVTINHRLNALGYLYLGALHDDFADSGNAGQLDIVLALQWVRDNIAAFGGDAGNVLIFGESGGGAKVSAMLATPPAKGLFHKAVIQSGPGLTMGDKAVAAAHAEQTLARLGIPKAEVHKLQALEWKAVLQAASAASADMGPGGRGVMTPVVDGRSLPAHPFTPMATEVSRDVPVMIGTTKDESTLFLSATPGFGKLTEEQVRARMVMMLGESKGAAALQVYQSLRPHDRPTHWLTRLATDMGTWINSIRLAERKCAQHAAAVYMFRLDWETPILDGLMKSPHGLDVPLVFDTVEKRRASHGPGPEPQQIANLMSQAWINFARSGDPSQRALPWPAYDTITRQTMLFSANSHAVADPDSAARVFWSS